MFNDIGVIAIGRNEGSRLRACLKSAMRDAKYVVYVDSGSTDDSVSMANQLGAEVVSLDMSKPFSAARGRNAGFQRLTQWVPQIKYAQFVDGDCEIAAGWLAYGRDVLESDPQKGAVCGRRRERHPEASVFNRICDIEWDTPIGETRACGGDAIIRCEALSSVGGYNDQVIAAEDDEVCVRMRQKGWTLHRLDQEMTLHDANMHTIGQWWKRAVRCGHGYAQGFAMHGASPERHFVKPLRSVLFWGGVLPFLAIVFCWPSHAISLLFLAAAYGILWLKTTRSVMRRGLPIKQSMVYATSCVFSKIPELLGASKYFWRRITRSNTQIIEYK
ncbi:N-glycosyltransferase [Planctomycetes bacterium CA13]|uniref:N-glycosyltransferase n=1 Tax=Novipirellula herctigrandis TaxID=2527986 RepID=A0A5C5Z3G8_9BACT|nr:N-glycosyltransferase [Planctomycetes bacterium CA13]